MKLWQNQRGQSLLEAIIGITILVAGLVTSLALGLISIRSGQVSQSRTIADNLAREGIERVRNLRDSNWLKQPTNPNIGWDEDLCDDGTAILSLSVGELYWNLNFDVDDINDDRAIVRFIEDRDTHLAYYFQSTEPSPSSEPTPFRRLITLTPDVDCGSDIPERYEVTATVQWTEYGARHESVLTEILYNWHS